MALAESNKETVARLFDAFRAGDTDAFDELIVDDYKQHNPLAGDGRQAVKDFFARFGPVDVEVYRVIAEGDFVVVHSHYKTLDSRRRGLFPVQRKARSSSTGMYCSRCRRRRPAATTCFSQLT